MDRNEARRKIWEELRKVAKPDSRFHWNFAEFIADYEGSDQGAELIRNLDVYKKSQVIFITPDNNMEKLREFALKDKKTLLTTTYGINRGFQVIYPGDVPEGREELATTLDGMEKFMKAISLKEIKEKLVKVDMLVTGASAITPSGIRFGKGHGYFDLEWAMLWEIQVVDPKTPVIAVGHDCQVVDIDIETTPYDTIVDYIVTPTRVINVNSSIPKPSQGIIWDKLEQGMIENIPPLQELYDLKHR
ncbi:MAG: methenyltetrahydrofolate synthetase [Thermoanaerobacteraceae bacterium]|nr:methenyltetrahydrofolate synthetase [Thermoanaerobacteraceae bacterium]